MINTSEKCEEKVLIVILNYITYQMTLSLVKKIRKKINYKQYDILVIDNGSPNDSASQLEANTQNLEYIFIRNKDNDGYAKGNNIGIQYAIEKGYSYTWILNNDVEIIDENILTSLVAVMRRFCDIGVVGPKIIDADGNAVAPYVDRPSLWDMTLGIVNTKKKRMRYIECERKVYRVYGCCMLVRNVVMQQVNCMDERTFLYCEEEILAERLRKIAVSAYYYPKTVVQHMESTTVKSVQGKRKWAKVKIVLKSFDLYLKEYREFDVISRFLCKLSRSVILLLRG